MYRTQCALSLLALCVGLAHSFSWDFVLGRDKKLEFYNHGMHTYTEVIPFDVKMKLLTFDPVHNRVLLYDSKVSLVYGFDIMNKTLIPYTKTLGKKLDRMVFDPVAQEVFWSSDKSIFKFSIVEIKPGVSIDNNSSLVIKLDEKPLDIALDSCGGYIYWVTKRKIERARLDGSKREDVIDSRAFSRRGLAIDQQAKKMYWTEVVYQNNKPYIERSDLNGKNRTTLYIIEEDQYNVETLAVSKDFVYGKNSAYFWQLPKNPPLYGPIPGPKQITSDFDSCWNCTHIAVNTNCCYGTSGNDSSVVAAQTRGIQSCEKLDSQPVPNDTGSFKNSTDASGFCAHGRRINGESRCECELGYIGDKCGVSVCYNYCFDQDCSVTVFGQPKCSCYSPNLAGERCAVRDCDWYCSKNGYCSLNKETNELSCSCKQGYEGDRCEISSFYAKCVQTLSLLKKVVSKDKFPHWLGEGVELPCDSTDENSKYKHNKKKH